MFGSEIVDVAAGMVFTRLLLSLMYKRQLENGTIAGSIVLV